MAVPSTRAATLVEILQERASARAEAIAFAFLRDGELDEATLTYGALERRARQVAAALQEVGCAGRRAMLVYQPGLGYIAGFLGCLYAGATAVPAYPPDPFRMERSFPRFQAIVADCRPTALLTTSTILEFAGELLDEFPEFTGVTRLATDVLSPDLADAWVEPHITSDTLAFLQYTSGSTASPKGVMLTHANLMHNLGLMDAAFDTDEGSAGLIWLPPYHDMGLIGGILEPLYKGVPCTLLSPLDFLQRPLRWLQAISSRRATHSGGPNFAYDLCVRKATPEKIQALDLSSWRFAFTGAEPVRRETLERFSTTFAPAGFRSEAFYPCYGLAEATLMVSGGTAGELPIFLPVETQALGRGEAIPTESSEGSDITNLVGCGRTLADQQIVIVDSDTLERCATMRVGEVWVAGPSVAAGYWQNPEETERTFGARLPGSAAAYLRTGDLGFLDAQGNLFITGRCKDLIIIDGRNHYPQDIELTVEKCHVGIRPGCTAVFSVTQGGQELVVVVAELARSCRFATESGAGADSDTLDPVALTQALRKAIAENHDVRLHDAVFLRAGTIPKTSSGKIQRRATRTSYLENTLERWA